MGDVLEEEELRSAISSAVRQEWETSSRPLPLTKLGSTLSSQDIDLRKVLAGRKLRQYLLELNLVDVQIEHEPGNELVWHLFPSDVSYQNAFAPILNRPKMEASDRSKLPRYQNPFWTAFVKPIDSGKKRLIQLTPFVHFDDVDGSAPVPMGWYLISDDRINKDRVFANKYEVASNIDLWLKEHGIARDNLLAQVDPTEDETSGQAAGLSAFIHRLLSLPKHELARVQVPLDLIVAAFGKK